MSKSRFVQVLLGAAGGAVVGATIAWKASDPDAHSEEPIIDHNAAIVGEHAVKDPDSRLTLRTCKPTNSRSRGLQTYCSTVQRTCPAKRIYRKPIQLLVHTCLNGIAWRRNQDSPFANLS